MKEIERFLDNYESPVKIIGEQINSNIENGILKAVHSFGVDVDIEELKKALKYDRNQYMQGYEFGRKEAVKEFAEKLKQAICDNTYPYFDKNGKPVNIWNTDGFDKIDELLRRF